MPTNEVMDQRLHYTHYSQVAAMFVSGPENCVYSSAPDYAGEKGLLKIVMFK